jgi:hypothetical protein
MGYREPPIPHRHICVAGHCRISWRICRIHHVYHFAALEIVAKPLFHASAAFMSDFHNCVVIEDGVANHEILLSIVRFPVDGQSTLSVFIRRHLAARVWPIAPASKGSGSSADTILSATHRPCAIRCLRRISTGSVLILGHYEEAVNSRCADYHSSPF